MLRCIYCLAARPDIHTPPHDLCLNTRCIYHSNKEAWNQSNAETNQRVKYDAQIAELRLKIKAIEDTREARRVDAIKFAVDPHYKLKTIDHQFKVYETIITTVREVLAKIGLSKKEPVELFLHFFDPEVLDVWENGSLWTMTEGLAHGVRNLLNVQNNWAMKGDNLYYVDVPFADEPWPNTRRTEFL
jgi:hypothetical protein